MKYLVRATLIILCGLFIACGNNEQEMSNLRSENERLVKDQEEKDALMLNVVQTFVAIDSNMKSIRDKERLIQEQAAKSNSKESRQEVLKLLEEIDELTHANKELVVKIEEKFVDQNVQVDGAEKMISNLNEKNEQRKESVNDLKGKLATIHEDFRELFEEYVVTEAKKMELDESNAELKASNTNLLEKLNSVWYLLGTKSELKEKGLTDRKGVLDSQRLNNKIDRSLFIKTDLRKFRTLALNVKKARIITPHPDESYELLGDRKFVEKLIVKNPERFWSVSKYLLIEIEEE
jgi:chromosome segregation ATPase